MSENILISIFTDYPNIWKEPSRFRALLMDLIPQDKLLRNLLFICVEEQIPENLSVKSEASNMEINALKKRVIGACGCSEKLATEVINLWTEALEIKVEKADGVNIKELSIDDIDLTPRPYNCLRRAGITKVQEILDLSGDEFINIRNLGLKAAEFVVMRLEELGVSYESREHLVLAVEQKKKSRYEAANNDVMPGISDTDLNLQKLSIDDIDLSPRAYNCLRKAGIFTIQDILKLSGDEFINIYKLGLKSAISIVEKLEELGVPYISRAHLVLAVENAKKLRMQNYLKLCSESINDGDYVGFVEYLEFAVEWGYTEDYSIIGKSYMGGINGVEKDLTKGYQWLKRFYDDFKAGKVKLDDNSDMIEICYNLGVVAFIELEKKNLSNEDKIIEIDKILELWKEAIDYGPEKEKDKGPENAGSILATLGSCFYFGVISAEDIEEIEIPTDYEYSYKALVEAERLGSTDAIVIMADMYAEGKYVKQNEVTAANMYLRAAMAGNNNAIDWCQEHFIDQLPWNKQSDWSNVAISEVFQNGIAKTAEKLGFITFEDIKKFKISLLSEDNNTNIPTTKIRKLLVSVADYIERYDPSPDIETKLVIGITDVADKLSMYGYKVNYKNNIEDIFYWLKTFYEGYKDESIQISQGYDDITRVEYKLAICYAYGIGTESDTKRAEELLSKAIIHGRDQHQEIVLNSSIFMYIGEITAIKDKSSVHIEKDYKQAYRGFKKLSSNGSAEATYYLAKMFEDGNYVEKDLRQAIKLYRSASDKGYYLADKWLEEKKY